MADDLKANLDKFKLPPLQQNLDKFRLSSAPTSTPEPTISMGHVITPDGAPTGFQAFKENLSKIPGQLKSLGNTLVSGTGSDISAALFAPGAAKQANKIAEADTKYVSTILNLRKEAAANGQDTTHWDNLIRNYKPTGATKTLEQLYPELKKSNEQIAGDFAGLAANIISAGTLPGTAKAASVPVVGRFAGALRGAKAAAPGGALIGGAYGLSNALKSDKGVDGTVLDTGLGVLGGAAAGAAIGATTGAFNALPKPTADAQHKFAVDLVQVQPSSGSKDAAEVIASGKTTAPGIFKPAKAIPSAHDHVVAESVEDIVSPKKNYVQNIDEIGTEVTRINRGAEDMIAERKVPFNGVQLRSQLNKGKDQLKLVFASDKTAERTYDAVVDAFMDEVKNKDTLGLLKARQSFDQLPAIKKLLETDKLGENARREISLAVRGQANNYVADLLPPNNPYRALLKKQTHMIEAMENIGINNKGAIGLNKLQILAKKYPWLYWAIGGAATGIFGGAGIGVGRAVVGSTD